MTVSLAPNRLRAVVQAGVLLRWVAIAFAGLDGLLGPRAAHYLTAEILVAIVYNGIVLGVAKSASDEVLPRLALMTTVIDQFFCVAFIALYKVVPGDHQVVAYIPAMIESVTVFGLLGATQSTAFFLAAMLVIQSAGVATGSGSFDAPAVFGATMAVILVATCLTAVNRALTDPQITSADERGLHANAGLSPPLRLNAREQQVLRLLSEGYSNALIASRLGVSERVIKSSVERLLAELKARNRAEAVATASRLQLI